MLIGLLLIALAGEMIVMPITGSDRLIILLFSIPLLAHAATSVILLVKRKGRDAQPLDWWFSFLELSIGIGIIGSVFSEGRAISILLVVALYLAGAIRLVMAILTRYTAWHLNVLRSVVDLALATMLAANWPLSEDRATTSVIALLIGMSGWCLLHFAYFLHTHQHETALLLMPAFWQERLVRPSTCFRRLQFRTRSAASTNDALYMDASPLVRHGPKDSDHQPLSHGQGWRGESLGWACGP